jgi:hypothetical protein
MRSKNSLLANLLHTCIKEGFKVGKNAWNENFKIQEGVVTLEELWHQEQYKENRKNMKKWRVLYLDQLIQEGKEEIMEWRYINPSRGEKRKTLT